MNLPAYEYPRNALVDFKPINDAIDANRTDAIQREQNAIKRDHLALEKRNSDRLWAQLERQRQADEVKRIGQMARVIDAEENPQRRQLLWRGFSAANKNLVEHMGGYGLDPNDHMNGPKFLAAQAGEFDPMKRRLTEAQIAAQNASAASNRAHAGYYNAAAEAAKVKAQPQQAATTVDPLQGYGIDENGDYIPPPQQRSAFPNVTPSDAGTPYNRALPEPMKLGGPRDDIDASMRLDEGRPQPRGVQVAQVGQGLPPTLLEQARQSTFGRPGMTAGQVPGIVTTAKGATDVPATREAGGQRAYEGATPDQQARFNKMRQDQQFWTSAYGKPPRAGYYYGPNGQELAMADKVYKGDREQQALMDMNMKVIDEAHKSLLDQRFGYPGRALSGFTNYGENARAFSDLEGAATNLAFALSGKSVSNAERSEFMNRYAPKPGDSEATINHKVGRLKLFFNTMRSAMASGVNERDAWLKANTAMMQPQGAPAQSKPASGGWSIKRLD
jgi:hypothetical protein